MMHPFSIAYLTSPGGGLQHSTSLPTHGNISPGVPEISRAPSPPGSGDAYSRSPASCGAHSPDSRLGESTETLQQALFSIEERAQRELADGEKLTSAATASRNDCDKSSSASDDVPNRAVSPSSPESEKPSQSYIALISNAILSSAEKKLLLCDIYQFIMDNYPFYNNKEKAWRNSIRHNLSLNECFIKNGRADNGKGNFWSVHPACEEDFRKGDFRRRHARRRARRGNREFSISQLPIRYRYNIGYVPMTSSTNLAHSFHPYMPKPHGLYYPAQPMTSYPGTVAPVSACLPPNPAPLPQFAPYSTLQPQFQFNGWQTV